MPKVTEAHLTARRQQILDAAAACFARNGFHHTTMHDLCQMAELSPGALYRYFAGKEEIIEAMVRERQSTGAAQIEAISRSGSTLQVLEALADTFFGELENPQACALGIELWAEALRSPRIRELLNSEISDLRAAFTGIIRRGQERGEINAGLDAQAVAQVMVSFFEGLVLQQAADRDIDVWKYVDVMKAMMSGRFWLHRPEGVE
ncbi:MAG: TetR/AcrR family transcriptional regulator [Dehalococcoidia bacterium]|nr:TetR/AcrR family transcriptional regulator [Dehalococcoidia bacterium]